MPLASGSEHSASYVEEVTRGQVPASPAFKPLRHTGFSVGLSKEAIESAELGGRFVKCHRHGNRQVGGDTAFELSYQDFDDMLQAALCGTWEADTPSVGTDELTVGSTRRTFTLERNFADISQYIRYTGCEVNTFSLSVAPNAAVTGSIGFVGADQDATNTLVAGATYGSTSGECPFDSFTGEIKEGGSTLGIVTQVELSIENGIEPQFAIGSAASIDSTIAKATVTGTVTAYFQDVALLNKFINETDSSIEFTLIDQSGNTILFLLPNITYTGGQPDVGGAGAVTIAMPFVAKYDGTTQSNLVVRRTPV